MTLILRDYQIRSLEIMSSDTSVLDASEMGTGKTLTAVERVRRIETAGPVPRILVIAPPNTHRQWRDLFALQHPALGRHPEYLRIVGTFRSDPGSWERILKKLPGVYILSWEAMRGTVPRTVQIITEEAALRTAQAQEYIREAKRVLRLKRSSEDDRSEARKVLAEADDALKIWPEELAETDRDVPEGWTVRHPGGASRGYGEHYGQGNKITVRAVKEAMKHGDVPTWTQAGVFDLVIGDEIHRAANRSSTTKTALKQIRANAKHASSGTFAGNGEDGAWSVLNWLWPKVFTSYWSWARARMEFEEIHTRSGKVFEQLVGEKWPGAALEGIPCMVRWMEADIRGQLPPVVERIVTVPMSPEQRRIYDEFESQALAWIDGRPVSEPLPLVQRIRLRQSALGTLTAKAVASDDWLDEKTDLDFAASAVQSKIDAVRDIIEGLPEDEPVMVYAHSSKWVELCAKRLDGKVGTVRAWTGKLSQKRRDELKQEMGSSVRVIVAVISAVGAGTDGLQKVCRCEIWASVTEEEETLNAQVRKRLHRDGQRRVVQRWLLHAEDSIDSGIDERLRVKRGRMAVMYGDDKKV